MAATTKDSAATERDSTPTQVPRTLVRKLALETLPTDQCATVLADELVRGAGAHHALLGFGGRRRHDARLEMSRHGKDAAGCAPYDRFRHAAQQRAGDASAPVGADDDQINAVRCGVGDDLAGCGSGGRRFDRM